MARRGGMGVGSTGVVVALVILGAFLAMAMGSRYLASKATPPNGLKNGSPVSVSTSTISTIKLPTNPISSTIPSPKRIG